MARTLVQRYGWARELVNQADRWLQEIGIEPISPFIYRLLERAENQTQIQEWLTLLASTKVAQPALCLVSLIWLRYLKNLGIEPVAVGGHSLGELIAFYSAGAFDEKALICLAAMRGKAMSTASENAGIMASLACSQTIATRILEQVKGYVIVANINSPSQTVISGDRLGVEEAVKLAQQQNIQTHLLPVSNAFHSEKVKSAAEYLEKNAPIPEQLSPLSVSLFSSTNGEEIKPGINLKQHFAHQVTSQVDFISMIENMTAKCDLMVEVGSGKVLSGLVSTIPDSCKCFPLESKPGNDFDLNNFLAYYFVNGGEIKWEALYENRLVRPFIPAAEKTFIVNPCERPFNVSFEVNKQAGEIQIESPQNSLAKEDLETFLTNYLSERGAFLAELIKADLESLPFVTLNLKT